MPVPRSNTTIYYIDAAKSDPKNFRCYVHAEPWNNNITNVFVKLGRTDKTGPVLKDLMLKWAKLMTVKSLDETHGWRWILPVLSEALVVKPPVQSAFSHLDEDLEELREFDKIKQANERLRILEAGLSSSLINWDSSQLSQKKEGGRNIIAVYAQLHDSANFTWFLVVGDETDRGICISSSLSAPGLPVVQKFKTCILSLKVGSHSSSLDQWLDFAKEMSGTKDAARKVDATWIPPLLSRIILGGSGIDASKRLDATLKALQLCVDQMVAHKKHLVAFRTRREAARDQKHDTYNFCLSECSEENPCVHHQRYSETLLWTMETHTSALAALRNAHDTGSHSLMGFLRKYEVREEEEEEDWRTKRMNSYMRAFHERREQEKRAEALALEKASNAGKSFKVLPPKGANS